MSSSPPVSVADPGAELLPSSPGSVVELPADALADSEAESESVSDADADSDAESVADADADSDALSDTLSDAEALALSSSSAATMQAVDRKRAKAGDVRNKVFMPLWWREDESTGHAAKPFTTALVIRIIGPCAT
jgi:hypothetical protein